MRAPTGPPAVRQSRYAETSAEREPGRPKHSGVSEAGDRPTALGEGVALYGIRIDDEEEIGRFSADGAAHDIAAVHTNCRPQCTVHSARRLVRWLRYDRPRYNAGVVAMGRAPPSKPWTGEMPTRQASSSAA
jgi:hypothetical protein